MAGKSKAREMYVSGIYEAGPGMVRVTLRPGDPPQKNEDGTVSQPRGAAGAEPGQEVNLVLPVDDAPTTYDKVSLKLESR